MNFGRWDFLMITGSVIALVLMSLLFPQLGLTGEEANETEFPEFNISTSTFDFAGDPPDSPGAPGQFELEFEFSAASASVMDNTRVLNGDVGTGVNNEGTEVVLSSSDNNTSDLDISVNNWTDGSLRFKDRYNLSDPGDRVQHKNESYEIVFEYTRIENAGTSEETSVVTGKIRQQPEGAEGFMERIPIVGGLFSSGKQLASMVAWIGAMLIFFVLRIIATIANAGAALVGGAVFVISTFHFLFTTYSSVIAGAPDWAAVIVAIPGIVIAGEFAKLIMLVVEVVWIG